MVKKSAKAVKKSATHAEFEPNKMGLAIATLAAVSLVLLAFMTML